MTGAPVSSFQAVKVVFPQVKRVDLTLGSETWAIFFYPEFESQIFKSDGKLREEAWETINQYACEKACQNFKSFREQVVWQGTPLLMGFFYREREVRFYSPRLGRELFLIEQLEARKREFSEIGASGSFKNFKEHAEKVASLPLHQFPSQYQLVTLKEDLPDLLNDPKYQSLEKEVNKLLDQLLQHLNRYRPSWFERISDFGLNLTAQLALLRIHLLKFLAILPSLDHDTRGHEVKRILLESLRRLLIDSKKARRLKKRGQERALPRWLFLTIKIAYSLAALCPAGPLVWLVRFKVRFMAKRFIAGESIDKVKESFAGLFSSGRDVTLDQLGELVVSEREADHYCCEVIHLIQGFGQYVPKGEKNAAGINRAHVSIKVSALCSDFRPYAEEYTYQQVAPRLIKILLEAKSHDVFINIDAEHYDYRDIVFKVYQRVLLETPELFDYGQTGIVLQAYLRDAHRHLMDIVELAKERNLCLPIRIVKGAYWDAETVEAEAHSFCAPEFLNKEETDLHFRQLIVRIFENYPHVQLCLASHNYADHCFAEVLRREHFSHLPVIEHQCLHMTYEALSVGLAEMNWPTRNYVPVGSLLVGMAYLVRRIMENSSQVGVLTMMRSHKKKSKMLSPMEVHQSHLYDGKLFRDPTEAKLTSEFFNMTPLRLYVEREFKAMVQALEEFKQHDLGRKYTNSFIASGELYKVPCSSAPETVVGEISFARVEDAKNACLVSEKAYESGGWSKAPWLTRSSVLLKAADLLLVRRKQLASLIVYEAGKSIPEAYADVDEAIDFLHFYACEERKIFVHSDAQASRGPIAAITPWNFPLAIPAGMVSAPLVAGNTVILKSAEQTPLIAQCLVDILHEAGVPQDVLIHLPGWGESVGDYLVKAPEIAGVVFTGSKAVGTMIARECQARLYHNKLFDKTFPVKAITEMGGKNAVIVTANAELDETVAGLLASAFGHAGQKCSAASRVIVDNTVKERLIERLKEACGDIEVSEAFQLSCAINPVITQEDWRRLRRQVAEAVREAEVCGGRVIVDRSAEELPGYCVGPVLIELPFSQALKPESFARRELFGPVVHLIGFDRPDQALKLFNSTEYGLTGGVFSQSQDDIDYYTRFMQSGNIYINRNITGARVAIEPFGGFKMSGTGPKAGSKAYLPSFHLNTDIERREGDEFEEAGSGYQFDLVRPSQLDSRQRALSLFKGIDLILHHFESLFEGIHGQDKKLLRKFEKWARKNLLGFIHNRHANRKIPGQLSYNDFTLSGEHALVVSLSARPSMTTLLRVLCALGVGVGVTVATRNQKSYAWWSRLSLFFKQAKLCPSHFDVYFAQEDQLKDALAQERLGFVIVDGSTHSVNKIGTLLSCAEKRERMVHLLSDDDLPNRTDFKRFCLEFVWVRAFAVNTMRHGAPLDLDL